MACSKFEYVKSFEQHFTLLKNTFIVVRIDGKRHYRDKTMGDERRLWETLYGRHYMEAVKLYSGQRKRSFVFIGFLLCIFIGFLLCIFIGFLLCIFIGFIGRMELLRNWWPTNWSLGHSFHNFTLKHGFKKPNDKRCLDLMNFAAKTVVEEFKDIVLAYGQSDEYSFVFKRSTTLYSRRSDKIATNIVSLFSSAFVSNWSKLFIDQPMLLLPSFDARCVVYPTVRNVCDYLSWRQADCHINNLYNTCFWELVQNPKALKSTTEAQAILKLTDSGAKNELLWGFGINYNDIDEVYRKGTILVRTKAPVQEISKNSGEIVTRNRQTIQQLHCDLIGPQFWADRPDLLEKD